MVDVNATDRAVLPRPVELGSIHAAAFGEDQCAAISQRIDERCRPGAGVVIELRARPVKQPLMVELGEPLQQFLAAAMRQELHEMGRAQEPMAADVAKDGEIVFGQADRAGCGAPEPAAACRGGL